MNKNSNYLERLCSLIEEISEDTYCAQWHTYIEYQLYDCLLNNNWPENKIDIRKLSVNRCRLDELRFLSDKIGGWMLWSDANKEPEFIEMNEWIIKFNSYKEGNSHANI